MTTLFSSKDIKTIAREIISRQTMECQWTDENGKQTELDDRVLSPVERIQHGIEMFAEELSRRFPVEGGEEYTYFAEDTPRLTK